MKMVRIVKVRDDEQSSGRIHNPFYTFVVAKFRAEPGHSADEYEIDAVN